MNDEEIFPGGVALYKKYRTRMAKADLALIQVDSRVPSIVTVKGHLTGPSDADETGVYIFGHGGGGKVGGYKAPALAALVKNQLQINAISKLALVSCSSAKSINEASFLKDFCEALHAHGLRPKVAGWDGYITICSPSTDHSFYVELTADEPRANKGQKFKTIEQGNIPPNFHGRKIGKGLSGGQKDKPTLVNDAIRTAKKHFLQINEEGVVNLTYEGWTQRNL